MILKMKVPSPGESIREVKITTWLVKDGDYVEKDQAIAEVDSDKATLELPAEASGIITLIAEEGNVLAVGAVLCLIDTSAGSATEVKVEVPKTAEKKVEAPKVDSAPEIYPTQKTSPTSHNVTRKNKSTRTNKSKLYVRSRSKWTDENSALLDVIEKEKLKPDQLFRTQHNDKEFRWWLAEDSTSSGIVGCLFIIVLIVIGVVFGADYFDNNSATEVQNENSVNETSTSDYNNSNESNRKIICPNCNGTGGDIIKKRCDNNCDNGYFITSKNNNIYDVAYGDMIKTECSKCNGTYKVEVKKTCEVCYGEGRVKEYE